MLKREPVAIAALIRGAALIAASTGFALTGEQIAAVIVVVELIVAVATRARVSPVT